LIQWVGFEGIDERDIEGVGPLGDWPLKHDYLKLTCKGFWNVHYLDNNLKREFLKILP